MPYIMPLGLLCTTILTIQWIYDEMSEKNQKYKNIIYIKAYYILAWEHSVTQGVIVNPSDNPRFVINCDFNFFNFSS